MERSLEYYVGVSWPRSGHHLLARLLQLYFGDRFNYCEFYKTVDCCKTVPCQRAGYICFSKNHDYKQAVPILPNTRYLVQYRRFSPALVSNFELYVRRTPGNDSARGFSTFARREARRYIQFVERWTQADTPNSVFAAVSYESLTDEPLDTMQQVARLFAPHEEPDTDKLREAIDSVPRITAAEGKERVEAESGVAARRNVNEFRFYDEALFESLKAETDAAYDALAARPWFRSPPVHGWKGSFAEGKPIPRRLYVDASGLQIDSPNPPTGIPRVLDFIVRQALLDEDPEIRVIKSDSSGREFRLLSARERAMIVSRGQADPLASARDAREKETPLERAKRILKSDPTLVRDFDRNQAVRITGSDKGARYTATKFYLRFYRKLWWWTHPQGLAQALELGKFGFEPGTALMAHRTAYRTGSGPLMAAGGGKMRGAFICHDLIPWLYPEYTLDQRYAKRLVGQLSHLLRSGVLALCTSDTSADMLRRFVDHLGDVDPVIKRFPLPSMLYETARAQSLAAGPAPAEPYVLFCSTVEVRKNHLLLARVWKRALDEGVRLPKLVCAGKWGWGVEPLKDYLAENPGLADVIEFTGPVDDAMLVRLYSHALFGVVPSFVEGWGLGASECLDFGVPVIVSDAPALQEAVRGLMPAIDPHDEDAWYREIRRLSEDAKALQQLRKLIGRKYRPVTERQSWEAIKKALRSR